MILTSYSHLGNSEKREPQILLVLEGAAEPKKPSFNTSPLPPQRSNEELAVVKDDRFLTP